MKEHFWDPDGSYHGEPGFQWPLPLPVPTATLDEFGAFVCCACGHVRPGAFGGTDSLECDACWEEST